MKKITIREAITHHKTWQEWLYFNLLFLFDIQILAISFLVTFALFFVHTYFIITNTTTWERFSRSNITYLRIIKNDAYNPFHSKYFKNIKQFFCYSENMRWEVTYARFIKSKYDEVKMLSETSNSSSEDSGEVKIQMSELNGSSSRH